MVSSIIRRYKLSLRAQHRGFEDIAKLVSKGMNAEEAVMAWLQGGPTPVGRGRLSVLAHQQAVEEWALAPLNHYLRENSEVAHYAAAAYLPLRPEDLEIRDEAQEFFEDAVRYLFESLTEERSDHKKNKKAMFFAEELRLAIERLHERMDRSGFDVILLSGLAPCGHDPRLLLRNGFEDWQDDLLADLDLGRSFPDLFSDTYTSGGSESTVDPEQVTVTGYGNSLSDRLWGIYFYLITGRRRQIDDPESGSSGLGLDWVLHFKGSEAWLRYHRKWGRNILTAAVDHLRRGAWLLGAVERMGHTPEKLLALLLAQLKGLGAETPGGGDEVRTLRNGPIGTALAEILGETRFSVHPTQAHWMSGLRCWLAQTKNGAGALLTMNNLPAVVRKLFPQSGQRASSWEEIKKAFNGREVREASEEPAYLLDALMDGLLREVHLAYPAADASPGRWSRRQGFLFLSTGAAPWAEWLRAGYIASSNAKMGLKSHLAWPELEGGYRQALEEHGFDESSWEKVRSTTWVTPEGRILVAPEKIHNLSSEDLAGRALEELEVKLLSFMADESIPAVASMETEPSPSSMSPGSSDWLTEVWRILSGGFLPWELAGRVLRPVICGRPSQRRKIKVGSLGHTLSCLMLFGYVAQSAQQILDGESPADPREPETWQSAFVQSGGAGLYGDFLRAEYDSVMNPGEIAGHYFSDPASDPSIIWPSMDKSEFEIKAPIDRIAAHSPLVRLAHTKQSLDSQFFDHLQKLVATGRRFQAEAMAEPKEQLSIVPPQQIINK